MAIGLNTADISEISLATAGFFFFFKSVHQSLQAASLQHTSKGQHSSSWTHNVLLFLICPKSLQTHLVQLITDLISQIMFPRKHIETFNSMYFIFYFILFLVFGGNFNEY